MFINWLVQHLLFGAVAFAAGGGGAALGSVGGGGSDGGGAPAGAGGGGAPAAAPVGGAQQQPGPESQGIAQLRTAYEGVKKELEPWSKLNVKPDEVGRFQGVYQKTFEEVAAIGRSLGYPDAEILEALQENPIATLDYLRNELAQAEQQQRQQQPTDRDLRELTQQYVQDAIGPLQARENERMTREANALFERTVYQAAVEAYKTEGIDANSVPPDEMFLLTSAASEILKYDEDALRALKYKGETAAVQKAFTEAKTLLDKYYIARSGRSGGVRAVSPQRGANGQFQPGAKKPSLDDIINDPGVISQKYAER